jgi:outer membrane protein OmpA-like peptidoglycan-associated protein
MPLIREYGKMKMKFLKGKILITSCTVFALLYGASSIQAENVHLGKDVASTQEIIDLLMSSGGNGKTRGLRLKTETDTAPAAVHAAEAVVAEAAVSAPKSISLEIYFEFDSAELSSAAVAQLAPVGQALGSHELDSLEFELEGFTDASGGADYNLDLSERRAESVRNYFIAEYGIAGDKLASRGRGEAELLDPENPNSGVNRRVKIIAQ